MEFEVISKLHDVYYVMKINQTCTRWFDESATTIVLSGPTAMPRGQVKQPGSLPRLPTLNCKRRFCRYWLLGEEPAAAKPEQTKVVLITNNDDSNENKPWIEASNLCTRHALF